MRNEVERRREEGRCTRGTERVPAGSTVSLYAVAPKVDDFAFK